MNLIAYLPPAPALTLVDVPARLQPDAGDSTGTRYTLSLRAAFDGPCRIEARIGARRVVAERRRCSAASPVQLLSLSIPDGGMASQARTLHIVITDDRANSYREWSAECEISSSTLSPP